MIPNELWSIYYLDEVIALTDTEWFCFWGHAHSFSNGTWWGEPGQVYNQGMTRDTKNIVKNVGWLTAYVEMVAGYVWYI